jgi:hypothetical protein
MDMTIAKPRHHHASAEIDAPSARERSSRLAAWRPVPDIHDLAAGHADRISAGHLLVARHNISIAKQIISHPKPPNLKKINLS